MKITQMKDIFKVCQLSNDSVRMVGLHGIGKSQIVEEFASENNFHIETLFLSQQEVADLIGIPTEADGVTYWSKPVWLKRMEDANSEGKQCICFLDEISRASLEVRQSALQLVLEGKIHEHQLPKINGIKTFVVAADNPSDLYQTDELDPALLDRFANFNVEVDVKGWLDWARKNKLQSVVTDYIAEYPEKLHFMPEDENDLGATPRSWAKLSDIVSNFDIVPEAVQYNLIIGKVGGTCGNSFFHFFKNYIKVIKPKDLKDMIENVKPLNEINTVEDFKEVAKSIQEKTQDIEAITAQELAEKLKGLIEETDSSDMEKILTIYLDSLNIEVMVSIIKGWKENKETQSFYMKWSDNVPGLYIFKKIIQTRV